MNYLNLKQCAQLLARLVATAAVFALPASASAADPDSGTVSETSPNVSWTGGPFVASNPTSCTGPDCDYFSLTVEPPAGMSGYSVVIEIDTTSTVGSSDDYDMFVYTPDGTQAGSSTSAGSFERVTLVDPPAGTYTVEVQPWVVGPGSTYAGQARLAERLGDPEMVAVAPQDPTSIFATPTLMDSQLHTGEPSIAVSPVLPADGSRPLIVGDAPWGTSNATSLWWRSRDGGESYELIQDPLAAPRPRPCEEIDGGGDSDTAFDKNGDIYVNDLAALINITVGESDDDFQTMNCTKAGGSNPLQPIQDRQWIVAAPTADGTGPGVDAYVSFRRGLINGNPVTETAIQIYQTTDGGLSYDPVGEIQDFFGFDNSKVSQTGNPVVDTSGGPRHGTLYHSYYLASTVKLGRYNPNTGTFEALTVHERQADVGNVFPTLAIDTEGNLYYGWIEGGSFDVLVSTSTDGGDSWSAPVRVNLPGASELAVNPYMVAGSPGRVAILYNATEDAPSPDGAHGKAWNLFVSQSLNALSNSPTYTQYKVTDTPLHFNSICTSGLGCSLQTPEGDRSLLEFNEVDIDPLDGSMVFIFADNGRLPQAPLAADEIPQPYIMATRQIAGASMLEGKAIQNTLPRRNSTADRAGDATYPKAGTAEGPQHDALDLLGSHLEETETGVLAVVDVADLSDLSASLAPTYGLGDPRLTQKASWVTRFEVRHTVGGETREEVFALGMEYDRVNGGPTCWYGTVGVARNATLSIKRSNYSSADGVVTASDCLSGNTISVEIPFSFMGLDLVEDPAPVFHSVVSFALVQPEAELEGMPVASYFNNQRTVDATAAYDWILGEPVSEDVGGSDEAKGSFRLNAIDIDDSDSDSDSDEINAHFDAKRKSNDEIKGHLHLKDEDVDVKIHIKDWTDMGPIEGGSCGTIMLDPGANAVELRGTGEFERDDDESNATFRVCAVDNDQLDKNGKKTEKSKDGESLDRFYLECVSGCSYNTGDRQQGDDIIDRGNIRIKMADNGTAGGGSASTSDGSASTVFLEPALLDESAAGVVQQFRVDVYDSDFQPVSGRSVTLTRGILNGVVENLSAITGADGSAVFNVTMGTETSKYGASVDGVSSNGVSVRPLLQ